MLIEVGNVTVEGEITKDGREEVHDEHAEDGEVANVLHSPFGWALGGKKQQNIHDIERGMVIAVFVYPKNKGHIGKEMEWNQNYFIFTLFVKDEVLCFN